MRALSLTVGLSLMAIGLLGSLASEFASERHASTLPEALRAPQGSRVLVRGLLESVREVAGGAALSTVTDCAGARATVFFPQGAPENISWRLVVVDATLREYKGALELVVGAPGDVRTAGEGAAVVSPDDVWAGWREMLCLEVAFTGQVAWGRLLPGDPRTAEIGVRTEGSDLRVLVHSESYLELTVDAGARVTFVGVIATEAGSAPEIHVKI